MKRTFKWDMSLIKWDFFLGTIAPPRSRKRTEGVWSRLRKHNQKRYQKKRHFKRKYLKKEWLLQLMTRLHKRYSRQQKNNVILLRKQGAVSPSQRRASTKSPYMLIYMMRMKGRITMREGIRRVSPNSAQSKSSISRLTQGMSFLRSEYSVQSWKVGQARTVKD